MARELQPIGEEELVARVDQDWWAFYTVNRDVNGDLVISRLRFQPVGWSLRRPRRPAAPVGGLTRDVLKRFRIGTTLRRAKRAIAAQSWAPPVVEKRRGPGRPPITTAEYQRWDRRLKQLEDEPHPEPLKQLWLENPGVSRTAMAQRMSRWRRGKGGGKNAAVSRPLAESESTTKKPSKKRGS
jgi:hypothetical protein